MSWGQENVGVAHQRGQGGRLGHELKEGGQCQQGKVSLSATMGGMESKVVTCEVVKKGFDVGYAGSPRVEAWSKKGTREQGAFEDDPGNSGGGKKKTEEVIEVSITGKQWGQGHRQGRILHYHRAPLVGLTLSQPNPPPPRINIAGRTQ